MDHLPSLSSNLQHLSQTSKKQELVPSLWGNYVYSNCLRATWNAKWIEWFWEKGTLCPKIDQIIQTISEEFHKTLTELEKSIQIYEEYLKDCKNDTPKEFDLQEHKKFINGWTQWIHPVLKYFKQESDSEMNVQSFVAKKNLEKSFDLNIKVKKLQKIIDLERETNTQVPVFELYRLFYMQLKEGDSTSQTLQAWIHQCSQRANVRLLHKGLLSIFGPKDTIDVEWLLTRFDINLWKGTDDKYLMWKENLLKKDLKALQKIPFAIDQPLGMSPKLNDFHITFSIQDDPKKLVVVCVNPAMTTIEEKEYIEVSPNFLPRIELISTSSNGKYKIMERYGRPVTQFQWISSEKFSSEEEELAKKIASLIKALYEGDYFLELLSPTYLLYDPSQGLKTYKVFIPIPLQIEHLENFAFECSQGNRFVFNYFMESSGARNHSIAAFFREVMEDYFGDKPLGINELATRKNIDKEYQIKAQQLILELKQKFNMCMSRLKNVDQKELKITFLNILKQSSYTFLWPNLVEEVISKFKSG